MKLQKDKPQIVEFQIEIEGTQDKIIPRLLLKSSDVSLVYDGKMKGKNAIFEVSKLDKIFENAKETEAEIEVIVEGKYFTPWKSTIEFESPVKITVTESTQPKSLEPSVKINVKPKEPEKWNKSIIKEGQQRIKINGKMRDVLVTKVITENGKIILKAIDDKGKNRTFQLKESKHK